MISRALPWRKQRLSCSRRWQPSHWLGHKLEIKGKRARSKLPKHSLDWEVQLDTTALAMKRLLLNQLPHKSRTLDTRKVGQSLPATSIQVTASEGTNNLILSVILGKLYSNALNCSLGKEFPSQAPFKWQSSAASDSVRRESRSLLKESLERPRRAALGTSNRGTPERNSRRCSCSPEQSLEAQHQRAAA